MEDYKMERGGRYPCVKRKYFFASSRQRDELDMFIPVRPIRARVIFFSQPEMPPRPRTHLVAPHVFPFGRIRLGEA